LPFINLKQKPHLFQSSHSKLINYYIIFFKD